MPYIYLQRLHYPEKNRIDPDDIWKIQPIQTEGGIGSLITFKNQDSLQFAETPKEIERLERRMRYVWPNLERIITAIIGGIIGGLLTWSFSLLSKKFN
jgi:hypothetical protein